MMCCWKCGVVLFRFDVFCLFKLWCNAKLITNSKKSFSLAHNNRRGKNAVVLWNWQIICCTNIASKRKTETKKKKKNWLSSVTAYSCVCACVFVYIYSMWVHTNTKTDTGGIAVHDCVTPAAPCQTLHPPHTHTSACKHTHFQPRWGHFSLGNWRQGTLPLGFDNS